MTPAALFSVVLLQIAVFQVGAIGLSESILGALAAPDPISADVAGRVAGIRQRLRREHLAWAAALIVAAVLALATPSLSRGERKVGLAAVSLASTGLFLTLLLRDSRSAAQIASVLAESTHRAASLEPRSLRQFYSPWREAVPLLIVLVTVALTVLLFSSHSPGPGLAGSSAPAAVGLRSARVWIGPLIQATWALVMLAVTIFQVKGPGGLALNRRGFRGDPERAVEIDHALRALQLRHLLFTKTAVTVLIGAVHIRAVVLPAVGREAAALRLLEWALVGGLLIGFAGYIHSVADLHRRFSRPPRAVRS